VTQQSAVTSDAQNTGTHSSELYAWAVRVLYTWQWAWDNTLKARMENNPTSAQKRTTIIGACAVICVQVVLWASMAAVVAYPLYLHYIGRTGWWMTSASIAGALYMLYAIFQLWVYPLRNGGLQKYRKTWPDWVRYILPSQANFSIQKGWHVGADTFVAAVVILGAAQQMFLFDQDLRVTTKKTEACSVINVTASPNSRIFTVSTVVQCGSRTYTSDTLGQWTWNNTTPLTCLTYERGLISCMRS
jgi:membrane protein YdbS with pleckstrin-like domain